VIVLVLLVGLDLQKYRTRYYVKEIGNRETISFGWWRMKDW